MTGNVYPRRWARFLRAALLAAAWLGVLAGGAEARAFDSQSTQAATLSNGLRVVVSEDQAAPVVSLAVVVRAGSADDPTGQAGLAHLLEHLCWAGDDEADPRAAIEELGGATNAGTLRDFTRYYATVEPGELARALRALAAMVLRGSLDEAAVSRERSLIGEEAATRQDRPRAALNDLAYEALHGASHPYGRPIEGSEGSLATIMGADLSRFHRTWYVPNNMAVIIAGKVKFAAALTEVEGVFGGLAPAALPVRPRPPAERPKASREQVAEALGPVPNGVVADGTWSGVGAEAYVMAAFVGPPVSDPMGVASSDVLAVMLGHTQVGRLVQELQDRQGLARGVGVDFLTQRDPGLFGVWAICDPDKVAQVKEAMRAELARLASEPVASSELARAKRLLAAEYAFANETAADRVSTLGCYEAIDSYRMAGQYLALVRAVRTEDIARVAARYAGEPVWVVLRPGGARHTAGGQAER